MSETKFRRITTVSCLILLIFVMVAIWCRTITRQVLVKALGINNIVTELILFDNKTLQEDGLGKGVGTDELSDGKIDIDWAELYPFEGKASEDLNNAYGKKKSPFGTYSKLVNVITANTDFYTSNFLPAYDYWVERYRVYRKIINWNLEAESKKDEVVVIKMENGYLTYQEPYRNEEEINEIAESLKDFNGFLSEMQIPFYYVNLGSKVNPLDKQLSVIDISHEFSNENGDNLIAALSERNINTIDMRTLMEEDELEWYHSYYATDHHWTNITGMWAAGKIASLLNQKEGFSFDSKFFDMSNYTVSEYKDFWMGGQAVALNHIGCESESYSVITPKFDTLFDVEIPTDDYHEKGVYDEVLFDAERFAEITSPNADKFATDQAYSCMKWNNDPLGIIKNLNHTNNDGKKILILTDSFSWYLATYLACDVSEVDLIHPMGFDGSIRSYVEQSNPDVVLLMFCERNIKPIDWSTHKSQFDMR